MLTTWEFRHRMRLDCWAVVYDLRRARMEAHPKRVNLYQFIARHPKMAKYHGRTLRDVGDIVFRFIGQIGLI